MAGTTLITIGLLGTGNITTSGTYALDVNLIGTANIEGPGTTGAPIDVTIATLAGVGAVLTTDISNGATEIFNPLAGVGVLDTTNIGKAASGSIYGNGTLDLNPAINASLLSTINFFGTDNKLILEPGTINLNLLDSVNNFAPTDTIELEGITANSVSSSYTPGLLGIGAGTDVTLYENGSITSQFLLGGSYSTNGFQVTEDPNNLGVDLTTCFLEGTRLLGLHHDIAVETMEPGDRLITDSGAMRPVRWVGKRTLDAERHPRPETIWPIRIARNAIADGLPERTLYLSPDHALFIDGHLIPAKSLVNGRSIIQEQRQHITYYHVELESHDILLAESLPVESYLETGNRNFFENGGGAMILHPNAAQIMRETIGCAPFSAYGPVVAAIRARIDRRLPALPLTVENGFRAMAGGETLTTTMLDHMTYRIELPATATDVRLLSSVLVPADLDPASEDRRRLGLDISGLAVEANGIDRMIELASLHLTEGWHGAEGIHRWTNGQALVPATLLEGGGALIVTLSALTSYPVEADHEIAMGA